MSTVPSHFTGGCACGAVRYESTAAPVMMLHCHCRDCQRASGGPFSSMLVVAKDAFRLTQGSLQFFSSTSDAGGETRRGFCAQCGAPVTGEPSVVPHLVAIRSASLDDPSWFAAQADVWVSDAQPNQPLDPALAKFEKYPVA